MARSSRSSTRFSSSWPSGREGRIAGDHDFGLAGVRRARRAWRPDPACCYASPGTRLRWLRSSKNHGGYSSKSSLSCAAAGCGRDALQFRFHAVRQGKQSLRGFGRGLVGNDANQIRAFAEDHALRIGNAGIAQLDGLGVIGWPVSRILRAPAASPMVYTSTVASNWPWYL